MPKKKPKPTPDGPRIWVRLHLPKPDHDRLRVAAARAGVDMARFTRELVQRELAKAVEP